MKFYFADIMVDIDTSQPYEWTFDPRDYMPGEYSIKVVAEDIDGNNASDDIKVIIEGKNCGDGICDYEYNESCLDCPKDCSCNNGTCETQSPSADKFGCVS